MMIFDKPDSVELLDAVNHFLNEKIKDEVPPHLAFKLRIVENVLNIVSREITLGEKLSNEVISFCETIKISLGSTKINK